MVGFQNRFLTLFSDTVRQIVIVSKPDYLKKIYVSVTTKEIIIKKKLHEDNVLHTTIYQFDSGEIRCNGEKMPRDFKGTFMLKLIEISKLIKNKAVEVLIK